MDVTLVDVLRLHFEEHTLLAASATLRMVAHTCGRSRSSIALARYRSLEDALVSGRLWDEVGTVALADVRMDAAAMAFIPVTSLLCVANRALCHVHMFDVVSRRFGQSLQLDAEATKQPSAVVAAPGVLAVTWVEWPTCSHKYVWDLVLYSPTDEEVWVPTRQIPWSRFAWDPVMTLTLCSRVHVACMGTHNGHLYGLPVDDEKGTMTVLFHWVADAMCIGAAAVGDRYVAYAGYDDGLRFVDATTGSKTRGILVDMVAEEFCAVHAPGLGLLWCAALESGDVWAGLVATTDEVAMARVGPLRWAWLCAVQRGRRLRSA